MIGNEITKTSNTTPESYELHKAMKNMVDKGYDDITVSFRYYNKDGELIKQADFDKSDIG